jgi:Xaa-Pro dipeptidase
MNATEVSEIPAERAFPEAEYDARIAKTRGAMDRAGADVLLVHSIPNICYLTGFQTPLSDWYHCLILPRDGAPALQVCDPELAAMNTYVTTLLPVSWERMDDAADQLADHLLSIGAAKSRIGVEMRRPGLNPFTGHRLATKLPAATFVDADDLVLRLRVVKSAAEIAHLREAGRLSTLGMEAAIGSIHAGVTENTVTAAAMQAIVAAGGEYFCIDPMVRAGRRSGVTHATCKRAAVQPGDPVLMEFGGVYQRYCAPLLRTAVIGRPPLRLQRLADASLRTMDLLFANLRPGRTMGDVASAAMPALADVDPAVRMRGYFGYSIGIGFPPSWVERSVEIAVGRKDVLEPGMTFHLHRVLRVPGLMGAGFSETVVITQNGHELLTHFPRQLVVL